MENVRNEDLHERIFEALRTRLWMTHSSSDSQFVIFIKRCVYTNRTVKLGLMG